MRFTDNLLLLAAASTQVAAQSFVSTSAAPTSTSTPDETGQLGDATEVDNNPVGVVYKAVLPEKAFWPYAFPEGGNIKGEVSAEANPDGEGVVFTINLTNLPKIGADIPYHLHVAPVPEDGNCTATLAHLDPFVRGEATPCDPEEPETCQVGDLSGKFGKIPADSDHWNVKYTDAYASTLEGLGSFFGNRSIVFHYPNKTRITCASFKKVKGGANLPHNNSTTTVGNPGPTGTGGVPSGTAGVPPPPSTSAPVPGAAAGLKAGIAGAVVFGAAVVFML